MVKKKYLMNCFRFLMDAYSPHMPEYEFKYHFVQEGFLDFIKDYFVLRRMIKRGDLDKYDVVHINNWLNFLNLPPAHKRKNQVWVSSSHGFHLGLNDKKGLEDSSLIRKSIGWLLGILISNRIQKKLREFDICYAAIPNVAADLKRVNPASTWLPNPIDIAMFYPRQGKKMEGEPAVFSPTRMHKMKTPEMIFNIFDMIKNKRSGAKLHLIRYPERMAQYGEYKALLSKYSGDIVWHDFRPREKLPELYSSFDFAIGSFGKGLLSLVEMEAMACGTTVITHDEYEIVNVPLDRMREFVYRLLEDDRYRMDYSERCTRYVREKHDPKNITDIHRKNIQSAFEKKKNF